ncbi:RidA family protein [Brevibacillus ginsengisoli]|uniref:RidA family protein n=1 Tax=Brevibacillus ginsengisoli TaxID=363854 RepID=UPI003CF1B827
MKKTIMTDKAPGAIGPYSQAIVSASRLYVSGQLGINPQTGEMDDDFATQAKQVMENISAILNEAGYGFEDIVKTTIFMSDLANFTCLNEIYGSYFPSGFPARSCFQVAGLPKGAKVEIELIAEK